VNLGVTNSQAVVDGQELGPIGAIARIGASNRVIPAAVVIDGVGAGSGQRSGGDAGDGGGLGVIALPVGAFVIKAGRLRWHPAVNANLVIVAAAVVAVTYLRGRRRAA
jgi:hypothetical protein